MIDPEEQLAFAAATIEKWRAELAAVSRPVNEKWAAILRQGPPQGLAGPTPAPAEPSAAAASTAVALAPSPDHRATGAPSRLPLKRRLLPGNQNTIAAFAAEAAGGTTDVAKVAQALRDARVVVKGAHEDAARNCLRHLVFLGFMASVNPAARDGVYSLTDEGRRAVNTYRGRNGDSPLRQAGPSSPEGGTA